MAAPRALPAPLVPFAQRPGTAALFLDFDGTLAPIVADPADARPLPGVGPVLGHLARRVGLVAVVSGRPVAFLLDVLGAPRGVHLVGLYGMESAEPDRAPAVVVTPAAEAWRPVVARATERALATAPPGAWVEPKGLTVTLHWRGAPGPEAEAWAHGLAADERAGVGLVAQPGRFALELRPPLETDKGTVLAHLAPGHESVAVFGDDLGDLAAFAAADGLVAPSPGGPETGVRRVVKVAVVDEESPPQVAAASDVTVTGPDGALGLLEALAEA